MNSWFRVWTWVSCTAGRFFTIWATREAWFVQEFLWNRTKDLGLQVHYSLYTSWGTFANLAFLPPNYRYSAQHFTESSWLQSTLRKNETVGLLIVNGQASLSVWMGEFRYCWWSSVCVCVCVCVCVNGGDPLAVSQHHSPRAPGDRCRAHRSVMACQQLRNLECVLFLYTISHYQKGFLDLYILQNVSLHQSCRFAPCYHPSRAGALSEQMSFCFQITFPLSCVVECLRIQCLSFSISLEKTNA